jgi:hypothetical protein
MRHLPVNSGLTRARALLCDRICACAIANTDCKRLKQAKLIRYWCQASMFISFNYYFSTSPAPEVESYQTRKIRGSHSSQKEGGYQATPNGPSPSQIRKNKGQRLSNDRYVPFRQGMDNARIFLSSMHKYRRPSLTAITQLKELIQIMRSKRPTQYVHTHTHK